MANIQTITVDMDRLNNILDNIKCSDCLLLNECVGDGRTCAKTIFEDYLQPEKLYRVYATMVREDVMEIRARSEHEAFQKAEEHYEKNESYDSIDIGIEEV